MKTPRFPPGKSVITSIYWRCRYRAVTAGSLPAGRLLAALHVFASVHLSSSPAGPSGAARLRNVLLAPPAHPAVTVPLPAVPTQQVSAAAPEASETNPGGGGGGHLVHGTEGPWERRQSPPNPEQRLHRAASPAPPSHPGFSCWRFKGFRCSPGGLKPDLPVPP